MLDLNAVKDLFNHYHEKVKLQPSLYATGNYVTVVLPTELKDYANAAAGTGVGDTHTPVGIRKASPNAKQDVKRIFASVDSLAEFIKSSECNAYLAVEKAIAKKGPKIDNRPADTAFAEILKKININDLVERFGKEDLLRSRKTLTVNEFELRYGI